MRLDVSGATAVPWPSNARVGTGLPDDDAIIAHGFRNPFRFTIHPGSGPLAGEVWIGDVGADTWDEINRLPSPSAPILHFGWPCYEGGFVKGVGTSLVQGSFDAQNVPICEGLYNGTIASSITPPVFSYRHGVPVIPGEACSPDQGSVTGMVFYESGGYPLE